MSFIAPLPLPLPHPRKYHISKARIRTTAAEENSQHPESQQETFQRTYDNLRTTINKTFNKLYHPLPTILRTLSRPFHKTDASFIHPEQPPKAVFHFLDAAFFRAAPHILYHTFLTKLAKRGYVLVATPYELTFEYLPLTERICSAWENVEIDLAGRYGPLPEIGLGRSTGALFHALSSFLFEDLSPRAGLALISCNNRDASEVMNLWYHPFSKIETTVRNGLPDDVKQFLERIPCGLGDIVAGPLTPEKFVDEMLPTVNEARRFLERLPGLVEEMGGEAKS